MKRGITAFCFSMLLCSSAFAVDGIYAVAGIGFADAEIDNTSSSDFSYRLALGYEFHPQWQAEFGYQSLVDDDETGDQLGISVQALTLSALGKAKSRRGELYYRIGIAYLDASGQIDTNTQNACDVGSIAVISSASVCSLDEGFVGGVLGLGYDLYVGLNSAVRFETEYLFGDNQFSAATAYVSFKYKF